MCFHRGKEQMSKNHEILLYLSISNRDTFARRKDYGASYPTPSQATGTKEMRACLMSTP